MHCIRKIAFNVNAPFSIAILAGGQSSRMGTDKAFVKLKDKFLIEHVINAVLGLSSDVSIIANEKEKYQTLGLAVYSDEYLNSGPLAGIHSALVHAQNQNVLILSCDSPFIQKELIAELINEIDGYDACVPVGDGKIYPLTAIYSKKCLLRLSNSLQKKQLKVKEVLQQLHTNFINFDETKSAFYTPSFINLNTLEDIKNLQ